MKRPLLLPWLLAAALFVPAPAHAIVLPPWREARLPNGTVVALAEKHDVPLIAFRAYLRGGGIADPKGKEGIASLTGGLLRKGAGKRGAQEIAALVDGIGADLDTGGGREASYVSGEFLTRDQTVMLDLLADVLQRPTFPADEFEKLRSQSINEITSSKDDPRSMIGDYAFAFLYGEHPYARPVEGDEVTLRGLTREDVLAYYRANYGGDRLILSVVGDFSAPAMEKAIRARFGSWAKAGAKAPQLPAPARRAGRHVLLVDKPDATQSYFWIGNIGVAELDPDRVALDVANTAYGGRYTSILNTELRIKGGLTYGASWQAPRFGQPGTVAIASFTKNETTGKAVDKALETLAAVRRDGIDPKTLESAKSYISGQFPPRLETEDRIAIAFADLLFYGKTRDELERYTDRVAATGPEDVKRVIQRVYPPVEDLTFVFIGNAAQIRDMVKKYGTPTEVKITDPLLSRVGPSAR